jgi:hypothetical protein
LQVLRYNITSFNQQKLTLSKQSLWNDLLIFLIRSPKIVEVILEK